MGNSKRANSGERREEIKVSAFKDIQIRFPGDVYLLAVWIALCDRAKSTPTLQVHATLHGLASAFVSVHRRDYHHPLQADDVMAIFRQHGIKGNPTLHLDDEGEISFTPNLADAATSYSIRVLAQKTAVRPE